MVLFQSVVNSYKTKNPIHSFQSESGSIPTLIFQSLFHFFSLTFPFTYYDTKEGKRKAAGLPDSSLREYAFSLNWCQGENRYFFESPKNPPCQNSQISL